MRTKINLYTIEIVLVAIYKMNVMPLSLLSALFNWLHHITITWNTGHRCWARYSFLWGPLLGLLSYCLCFWHFGFWTLLLLLCLHASKLSTDFLNICMEFWLLHEGFVHRQSHMLNITKKVRQGSRRRMSYRHNKNCWFWKVWVNTFVK